MSKRYAVVYRSRYGDFSTISSTHRFRWLADRQAASMNHVVGNSTDYLRAASELGISPPSEYYEVEEYEA